jgi:hypothetical protein
MTIDPRTMMPIKSYTDCHVIPAALGVSDLTVRLDADFDHKIGAHCDSRLQRFLDIGFGSRIDGAAKFVGGTRPQSAVAFLCQGIVAIPKPEKASVDGWLANAIGMRDGIVEFAGFSSPKVDWAAIFTSVVHSGFLLLYHSNPELVIEAKFESIRKLFSRAYNNALTNDDFEVLNCAVYIYRAFPKEISREDAEKLIRVETDWAHSLDDVFTEFPRNSVIRNEDRFRVILPYSPSLRGEVDFGLLTQSP